MMFTCRTYGFPGVSARADASWKCTGANVVLVNETAGDVASTVPPSPLVPLTPFRTDSDRLIGANGPLLVDSFFRTNSAQSIDDAPGLKDWPNDAQDGATAPPPELFTACCWSMTSAAPAWFAETATAPMAAAAAMPRDLLNK